MWVIRDADSTIYLFGTVHVLTSKTEWNTPRVQAAMKDSKELWLEVIDSDDPAALGPLIQKFGLDFAKPLSKKLTSDQYARVTSVAKKYKFPVEQLEPMQPWLAAVTLALVPLQQAGFDPKLGVETKLTEAAKQQGDALKQLESSEKQMKFFASLSQADQIGLLMQFVDDADRGIDAFLRAVDAWASGNEAGIDKEPIADWRAKSPITYNLLLTRRNIDWAGQIEGMLKRSGTQMIAVGAGHLVGPDSVQVQLKKRGIEATRLQ